jgi:hypothetical protein
LALPEEQLANEAGFVDAAEEYFGIRDRLLAEFAAAR